MEYVAIDPPALAGVYFAQSLHLVKVGWAGNVRRRMATLKMDNPHDLKLVAFVQTERGFEVEMMLHHALAAHRVCGEWFDLAGAREAIEAALRAETPAIDEAICKAMRSAKARRIHAARTPEQLAERNRKLSECMTFEQRSEVRRRWQATKTPDQLSEAARKGHAHRDPEQRRAIWKAAHQARDPEERADAARRGAITRRANGKPTHKNLPEETAGNVRWLLSMGMGPSDAARAAGVSRTFVWVLRRQEVAAE